MRLNWTFSACVHNFPLFLRKDATTLWLNNLSHPAIVGVLHEAKKERRCVLKLSKKYEAHFDGGKFWKVFRGMFCYAFGKTKKRRGNHRRRNGKKFPGGETTKGSGPSLIKHLPGVGVSLDSVTRSKCRR